jgi:HK97 family phage prohead protease
MAEPETPETGAESPAAMLTELRSAALADLSVRGRTIGGYAAVYDQPWNPDLVEQMGYTETIARGAFRKALSRSPNVPLLWQHERRDVLATTKSRTLRLKDDARGLAFEADLPKTQLGDDLLELVHEGIVGGMSYGIGTLPSDSAMVMRGGRYFREVRNAQKLLDVTLTYEPSYEAATVELRSAGFVAAPLQEILDGVEVQVQEAALAPTSAADFQRRLWLIENSISPEGG